MEPKDGEQPIDPGSTPKLDSDAWTHLFPDREWKCIQFARLYHEQFDHGEPGHLHYTIIAKLTEIIRVLTDELKSREESNHGTDEPGPR